ncbi:MAG: hypothetical protein KIH08_15880 [Candidatus Freyarchaeota archaeon]|nr:hypothetical protein [Candidatus Jordarchaeia archaeon]
MKKSSVIEMKTAEQRIAKFKLKFDPTVISLRFKFHRGWAIRNYIYSAFANEIVERFAHLVAQEFAIGYAEYGQMFDIIRRVCFKFDKLSPEQLELLKQQFLEVGGTEEKFEEIKKLGQTLISLRASPPAISRLTKTGEGFLPSQIFTETAVNVILKLLAQLPQQIKATQTIATLIQNKTFKPTTISAILNLMIQIFTENFEPTKIEKILDHIISILNEAEKPISTTESPSVSVSATVEVIKNPP